MAMWSELKQPAEIATEDAVYVLAYSVIMLNTDLHNPQNRVSLISETDSDTQC